MSTSGTDLILLPSRFTGYETVRSLYVTPEILEVVEPPYPDGLLGDRYAEFRNFLDAFSEGGEFSVCENPYEKPPETMLARVDPVQAEFWSMRILDPGKNAGIRCLGAFEKHDQFIALIWDLREDVANFNDEVAAVQKEWFARFGSAPLSGVKLDAYLSNYYVSR